MNSMADSKKPRFSWVGQFLAFVPGRKSPYQSAFVQVIAVEGGTSGDIRSYEVKLDKDIQEMAAESIKPRSWVRVSGKGKLDKKTKQIKWKAESIEAISLQTIAAVKAESEKAELEKTELEKAELEKTEADKLRSHSPQLQLVSTAESVKEKPARILICQKSSCRKKGSQKVSEAIEDAIAKANAGSQITVKSTGCLKCCKTGPTVVVLPSSGKNEKVSKERYRKVTPKSAKEIVASVL